MKSYISNVFACLLMVLLPLHAVAASNLALCNNMLQLTKANAQQSTDIPCHQYIDNALPVTQVHNVSSHNVSSTALSSASPVADASACAAHCAAICASLHVISIISNAVNPVEQLASTSIITSSNQSYVSITQANLLRPPIFLS
jgi:hypothetical protein